MPAIYLNETIPNIQCFQLALAKLWSFVNANDLYSCKAEFEMENTEYSSSKTVLRFFNLLDSVHSTETSKAKIGETHYYIDK